MSKHQLTYIDMYPEPVEVKEPSVLAIWAGAAMALVAAYAVTLFFFSM